jgi:hypothetical protein
MWLHRPQLSRNSTNAPLALMKAYLEQWLNGLVYELFFPDELHARKLNLFEETARLNPPDLSRVAEGQRLSRLNDLFEQAYETDAPLRAMLFSLRSLEAVRIIEEPLDHNAAADANES